MYAALADGRAAAQGDPRVRVVLLRGAGDLFCTGNDLGELVAVAAAGKPPQNAAFLSSRPSRNDCTCMRPTCRSLRYARLVAAALGSMAAILNLQDGPLRSSQPRRSTLSERHDGVGVLMHP